MIYARNRVRNTFLIAMLVLLILTATIFAILFVNGIRIDPSSGIVETGVIRINSVPEDVNVLINGKLTQRNGRLVQGVPVGSVEVTLQKEDFGTWQKTVTIDKNIVKDIYARLFPAELNLEQLVPLNIDEFTYSEDLSHIFFTVVNSDEPQDLGLWRYRLTTGILDFNRRPVPEKISNLTVEFIEQLKQNEYSVAVSPGNNQAIINIPELQIVNLYNTSISTPGIDLSEMIGFYPNKVEWFGSSDRLLLTNSDIILDLEVNTGKKSLVLYHPSSETVEYCASKNVVYYIDPSDKQVYAYTDSRSELVAELISVEIGANVALECADANENVLIIKDAAGIKFLDREARFFEKFSGRGEVVDVAANGRSVLIRLADNVYRTYNLEEQGRRDLLRPSLSDINIDGALQSIYFAANNNIVYVIESAEDSTLSLRVSDSDGQNLVEILNTQSFIPISARFSTDASSMFIIVESAAEGIQNFELYRVLLI